MIALVFAGRLDGENNLAVMGLAWNAVKILITSACMGLNITQYSLTSWTFGAGDYYQCGLYLNRGFLILTCFFIGLSIVPAFLGETIFFAICKDADVSQRAQTMLRLLLPHIYLNCVNGLWKTWLACQRVTFVPMVSSLVGTFLLVPIIYCCVYILGFGLNGIPLSLFIQSTIVLSTTVIYSFCKPEVRKCI